MDEPFSAVLILSVRRTATMNGKGQSSASARR